MAQPEAPPASLTNEAGEGVVLVVHITTHLQWSRPDWNDDQIKDCAGDMIYDHMSEAYGVGEVKDVTVTPVRFKGSQPQ